MSHRKRKAPDARESIPSCPICGERPRWRNPSGEVIAGLLYCPNGHMWATYRHSRKMALSRWSKKVERREEQFPHGADEVVNIFYEDPASLPPAVYEKVKAFMEGKEMA